MATNWQPPFGLPFPPFPPPQQQQPQAQPDAQSAPSDAYQPPPATAFVPPPVWNTANIPGLNFQAHNQNAQHAQFPSAWPAHFPTPDQLAQWNQMQMDMQQLPFMMMQNPPPIPGLGLASNPPSQSPFQGATPAHPFPALPPNLFPAPAKADRVSQAVQNDRIADVTESDKEEGEVSEGSRSPAVNGRTYPEPPRSVPLPSTRSSNTQDAYNPDQPSAGQASDSALQSKATNPARSTADTIAQQQSDAKAFIKLLHNNSIGYHALAAESLDASSLRDLYRSLNLPSEPEPVPSALKVNGNSQSSLGNGDNAPARPSPPTIGSKPVTAVNTSVPPTKSAPSPANRKEYLAQLQAAKKARQQGGAKITPPQNTPPPTSTASKTPSAPQLIGTSDNGQLTEAEKKAKTTELIRRRIEALKKSSSSPAGAAPSKPSVTGPTAGAYSSPCPKTANPLPPTPNSYATQAIPPSPFGNIPGLFMNPSPVVQPSRPPATPGSAKRKLSFPAIVNTPPLRTDKTDQVDQTMDVDDRQDAVEIPTQMTPIQNGLQGARTLPVLSGFPSRPASANPPASVMGTPGPQTPSGTIRNQEMDDKARKQAALKERLQKKIEEQKRQAEQKRLASVQNSPKPLPRQPSSLPKPNSGQEAPREMKRRRKADIEAEKSALDVDIAQNAARLAQITDELEILTANDKKMRLDKERLQAELESLGIDTEGMPHAELQAKKDEIEREQGATLETLTATTNLPAISPAAQSSAAVTAPISSEKVSSPRGATQYLSQPPEISMSVSKTGIPGLNAPYPLASSPLTAMNTRVTIKQRTPMPHSAPESANRSEQVIPAKHPAIFSVNGTTSNDPSKPATPVDDEEDFYSPEPADVLPAADKTETATGSIALARSPSEEGEMAMSESDEEDYEPEEAQVPLTQAQVLKDHTLEQNTSVMTAQVSSFGSPTPTNEDEDPYEPPDVDQPMMDLEPSGSTAEPNSNAQQGEIEEEEMDISTSSDSDSDSDTSSESSGEERNGPVFAPSSKNPGSSVTVADDIAPEPQLEASAVASVSQASVSQELAGPSVTQESAVEEEETNLRSFVPYESPLRLFKSYRYHPNFAQDVSSGFLSMTFSHQIDPEKPLCEHEASGDECTDADCPDQHFRDMNISGEKLLVQLGTANPGKTTEERQRWNDGLRGVLKALRQKNTKDPNGIAMEIANYRRQFLQDDTRVVNL
ncbi:hypothetical protein P171DRAFT_436974 [Karstenula rhodostoma CBS 690.94]|uniref:Putative zinc-finger domain-containing protein n=1 Tax=Karstenula rhodostoma CBS 690.94 TaxID=1392251 RepID=A0A9P4U5W6_9PLEO|nr:hypothetical protein P171DRAFT_436974 [Karstenula rhodostoma CBS 690.94]